MFKVIIKWKFSICVFLMFEFCFVVIKGFNGEFEKVMYVWYYKIKEDLFCRIVYGLEDIVFLIDC